MKYYRKKKLVIPRFINKFLTTILIFVITLVILKSNQKYREEFYKIVYKDNISFAKINKAYQDYFGSPLPFDLFGSKIETVFDEKLNYEAKEKYYDGVSLDVGLNYLVPSLENGIVIFVGDKENYGKTIIIECENGIEIWYSNMNIVNVKLYDYIKKGSLLGEVNENLYLLFMENGNILNYENHI